MTSFRVGYHRNQGGNADDLGQIGQYVARLSAAGLQPFLVSIGEAGHAQQVIEAGGIAAFAKDEWRRAPNYDSGNPTGDAAQRWQRIKAEWPPELSKEAFCIVLNEPRKEAARYVFAFILEVAKLANADGYRVCGPNYSTGTPEIDMWETAEGLAWLRYCSDHPDMAAVAVHEYSLSASDIRSGYPWLVGRHQFVLDVCDEHGIPYPPFLICEFGWTYKDMPGPEEAMRQLTEPDGDDPAIVDVYGDIPIALWTLGRWDNGEDLPPKMARTIPYVTDWMLANSDPPEPEPEPEPDPGLWYKSIVVLAPQDYTLDQMLQLRRAEYANRRTITQSHDEALQLRQLGKPGSYTIVYDIGRWDPEIQAMLTAGEHELRSIEPEAPEIALSLPLTGAYVISSQFNAPREYANGKHEGVDFAPRTTGALCIAPAPGIVEHVGYSASGYGHYVRLRHEVAGLVFKTWIAHMRSAPDVSVGQQVQAGQRLGLVGSSGNSSGDHVHLTLEIPGHGLPGYVVRDVVDPLPFIDLSVIDPPALPLPPDYVDLVPYLMGDGRAYMVRHPQGNEEKFRTVRDGGRFLLVKNTNYEEFFFSDGAIYRGVDTSPEPGNYYRQFEPGSDRARWAPRFMRVGDSWTSPVRHTVQTYRKSDCQPIDHHRNGQATNSVALVGKFLNRTWNGVTVDDVIALRTHTNEVMYYARDFGLIGWQAAWGESFISKILPPQEWDNEPEVIGCL